MTINSKAIQSGAPFLAALAMSTSLIAPEALAQNLAIEEITVTARKRSESLLEVPLAITAFTETDLERQNIQALEDLAQWTPSLQFQDVNGAFQNPAIRGLTQTDQSSPQGNVGVFIDGVYLNNRSGLEFGLLDLQRIEIVKGPQSALYGRNTFGGAINYVTKQPELGEFGGRIEGTAGTRDRYSLSGNLNIPLGDVAAIQLFGGFSEFDGTIPNVRTGERLGGWNTRDVFGAKIYAEPTENTRVTLFAARNKVDNETPALALSDAATNNCGSDTVNPFGVPRQTLFCGLHDRATEVNLSEGAQGLIGANDLFYAKLEHDFDFATLTALASHTDSGFTLQVDTASNPNAINIPFFIPGLSVQSLIDASTPKGDADSYEIRLASADDSAIGWTIGGFHYNSFDIDTLGVFFLPLGDPNGEAVPFFERQRVVRTKATSVFGSLDYDFTDQLTASVELRYTDEKLELINSTTGEEQKFDFFAPRFTIDYQANDDQLFYANVGRGVKTGGFNTNVAEGLAERTFGEETNWTFEIGSKSTLFDGRMVATVSAWYVDWKDLQVQTAVANSPVSAVQNFGEARSIGIELDTSINVTENFVVRGAVAVMDPQYKDGFIEGEATAACGEFVNTIITTPGCSAEVGGNTISRTSDFQFSVSGTYTVPEIFQDYDMYVRADFSHEAEKFDTGLNFASQGDINLANARVGFVNENLEIAFWVDNVFDRSWNRRVTSVPFTAEGAPNSGVVQYRVYPGDTRTGGVDIRLNF
ncbi:MAG: TonB-dependent receptor [Alphaproteobacteria bacterium]|nr:TonB-dependent receptor [Alphaproteobacteria bacterium]